MKTIVALRRGGLGDLLIAAPSLHLLRVAFPVSRIILVSRPLYGILLKEAALVDEVQDADDFKWAALSGPPAVSPPGLPEADLAVGWFQSGSAEGYLKGASILWPKIPVRAFRGDPRIDKPLSRQFYAATAGGLPGPQGPRPSFEECARLQIRLAERPAGPEPSRPYAVLHPGAGSPRKVWPADRFREIIRALAARGFSGVIVLGEAEQSVLEEWSAAALPLDWTVRNRPDLLALAGLLSEASFYLGNDSGVTHLSAALGVPGLALFLTEFVGAWRPLGKVEALAASEIGGISVAAVLSRIPS